jgi:uncharacterized protein (DUF2141 family)
MSIISLASTFLFAFAAEASDLKIQITGLRSDAGFVLVALHDRADAFPQDTSRAVAGVKLKPSRGVVSHTFKDLRPGTYAFAAIHDENNNGKLDTNPFGLPKEGFGFSRDPRVQFSAPRFDEAAFPVEGAVVTERAKAQYL